MVYLSIFPIQLIGTAYPPNEVLAKNQESGLKNNTPAILSFVQI